MSYLKHNTGIRTNRHKLTINKFSTKIRRFLILRRGQLWKNFRGWAGWDEAMEGGRTTTVYLQQSLTSVHRVKQRMCQDATDGGVGAVLLVS